jgi:bis(5'-nucleosyl)-tetraphosphatase (symmetrical)
MKNRTIFIWDVHGCYKELKLLLSKLKLNKNDKVYFTWDLINWWPKSYKVLKYLYKNKDQFKSVAWNNDLWFLDYYDDWRESYFNTHSLWKFKKLKKKIEEKKAYYLVDYLRNLPLYIEKKDFILIHWGLTPWKKLEEHEKWEITTTRKIKWKPWYKYYNWEKIVIYGHFARKWLQIRKKTKWLDSGCVYGSWLTAFIFETGEIYSQTALNNYINLFKKKNENKRIEE